MQTTETGQTSAVVKKRTVINVPSVNSKPAVIPGITTPKNVVEQAAFSAIDLIGSVKTSSAKTQAVTLPGLAGTFPAGLTLPQNIVPTQGESAAHPALDIAGPLGTPIYAPVALKVTQSGWGWWGNDVIGVSPATGNQYVFGHFESLNQLIKTGDVIPAGTLLGLEGSTFNAAAGGYSTGPHVHFQEMTPAGAAVMPSPTEVLSLFEPATEEKTAAPAALKSYAPAVASVPAASVSAMVDYPIKAESVTGTATTPAASAAAKEQAPAPASPTVTPASSTPAAAATTPASSTSALGQLGKLLGITASTTDLLYMVYGGGLFIIGIIFLLYLGSRGSVNSAVSSIASSSKKVAGGISKITSKGSAAGSAAESADAIGTAAEGAGAVSEVGEAAVTALLI